MLLTLTWDGEDILRLAEKLWGIIKDRLIGLPRYYLNFWQTSTLAKNISKIYGGSILSALFSFVTSLFLIRKLSVNDYASYTAFYSICSLIPALVGGGINRSLIRFSAEYISRENRKPLELYIISFLFEIALFLIFCAVLLPMSDKFSILLFGSTNYKVPFQYGLIAGFGSLLIGAGQSVYQAEERFGTYAKSLSFQQILTFLFVFFLILLKRLNFSKSAQVTIVANLLVGIIIAYDVLKELNLRTLSTFLHNEFTLIKEFFSSTKWLIAYLLVLSAFGRLDIFMLSHFSTEEELANYGVAFKYYAMASILLGSIHAVLLPKFSKVDMQNTEAQKSFIYSWLKKAVWLIIPLVIADLIGKPVFIWINGIQYERAFFIFAVFSIGIWLSLMFSPLVQILLSRKEFRLLLVLSLAAFGLSFAGYYILVPIWGGFGTALVTIFFHAFIGTAILLRTMKVFS